MFPAVLIVTTSYLRCHWVVNVASADMVLDVEDMDIVAFFRSEVFASTCQFRQLGPCFTEESIRIIDLKERASQQL